MLCSVKMLLRVGLAAAFCGFVLPACAQTASPVPDPDMKAIVRNVRRENVERTIRDLAGFGTRNTLSVQDDPKRGIGAARDYLYNEFVKLQAASGGRLKVEKQTFLQPVAARVPQPTNLTNIVATLPGDAPAGQERYVIVSGHYDSMPLGVAFAAFAAAEVVHGSGFLAAFTAGMTIAALDVELCDCFLEYGETTAEMALLFTFVLLGASLIWSGFTLLSLATALFAVVVITVRPLAFFASFAPTKLDKRSQLIIAWFGPRGLSSLLLVLLPVFAGTPGADRLFSICCLVVVVSVALHGGSIMALGRFSDRAATNATKTELPAAPAEGTGAPTISHGGGDAATALLTPTVSLRQEVPVPIAAPAADLSLDAERISIAEMQERQRAGNLVKVLDVRTDRALAQDDRQATGAVRVDPTRAADDVRKIGLPHDAYLVAFCG